MLGGEVSDRRNSVEARVKVWSEGSGMKSAFLALQASPKVLHMLSSQCRREQQPLPPPSLFEDRFALHRTPPRAERAAKCKVLAGSGCAMLPGRVRCPCVALPQAASRFCLTGSSHCSGFKFDVGKPLSETASFKHTHSASRSELHPASERDTFAPHPAIGYMNMCIVVVLLSAVCTPTGPCPPRDGTGSKTLRYLARSRPCPSSWRTCHRG